MLVALIANRDCSAPTLTNMKTSQINLRVLLSLGMLLCLASRAVGQQPVGFIEGIPNFDRVNDRLYRGGQPDEQGVKSLLRLGIKTIVNLRQEDDIWAAEATNVIGAGLIYTNVPMSGRRRPTDEQVAKVLSIIETFPAPVFIHCRRGADRTGTIIACYRIKHDKWSSKAALHEARQHGMSRWVWGMKKYVEDYHEKVTAPSFVGPIFFINGWTLPDLLDPI